MCPTFTIVVADPRFRNVTTSQSGSEVDLLNFFRLWLVVTLRNLGSPSLIVKLLHKVRLTPTSNFVRLKTPRFTQGAPHPDEQLCSIEDPTFHCKV
ncbi:predicted protein [Lichtheimia corymbifera JMRC:FSU:9682]|uniref:Uncharacterized protein n=1 Tax=Lichtheimia corymbifera JMRC:FSU:9682 TaxID=1263082 RepID=A0A068S9N6_9FUNG|nr:predicted protein [Lichtheimia corymbifera JMRC:FSU:9682]